MHRAQQCSDLEQGSINLGDYLGERHSDEKPYRNRKKRKGPIWEEKNTNNHPAACLQVIPKIAASGRSQYICWFILFFFSFYFGGGCVPLCSQLFRMTDPVLAASSM